MTPYTPAKNQRKIPVWVGVTELGEAWPGFTTFHSRRVCEYHSAKFSAKPHRFLLIDPKYYKVVKR